MSKEDSTSNASEADTAANPTGLLHGIFSPDSNSIADLVGHYLIMVIMGLLIGYIEGWKIRDALYFTFVTGLTIGYGDLTPRHIVSRCLAVVIGFSGIVMTGLVAAVSVRALEATARDSSNKSS